MTGSAPVVEVVGCSAGGLEHLRAELVEPLLARGFRVAVTLTPSAARWLADSGESDKLATVTGLPVRSASRLPTEVGGHPTPDVLVVAPATANTVAKIALGIADSQALTVVNEGMGVIPVVIFPRVNAAHARHPAWQGHLDALRAAGVRLVYGPDVWPLHEPRTQPARVLPWGTIIAAVNEALASRR